MATSSITDQVVLNQEGAEKLAELLKNEPTDDLRRFTEEERIEMRRKSKNAFRLICERMDQIAGDSK